MRPERRLSGRNGGATEVALLKGWVYSSIGVNHSLREKLVWVRVNVEFPSRPEHLLKTAGGVHTVLRRPDSCLLTGIHTIQNLFPFGLFERRLDESLSRSEFIDLLTFLQSQKSREMAQLRNP
jgi:hypothetical protein